MHKICIGQMLCHSEKNGQISQWTWKRAFFITSRFKIVTIKFIVIVVLRNFMFISDICNFICITASFLLAVMLFCFVFLSENYTYMRFCICGVTEFHVLLWDQYNEVRFLDPVFTYARSAHKFVLVSFVLAIFKYILVWYTPKLQKLCHCFYGNETYTRAV